MSTAEGDPGVDHSSSDNAHGGAEIEQQHSNQANDLAAWTERVREGMGRMANDEAERLKVSRRLF